MVFISCGTCDKRIAEALYEYLVGHGIDSWVTFRNRTSGNYSGEITRALKACDTMVVICSDVSCRSEHVKNEVSIAFDQKKIIIPYLLDENPFDDDLVYFLSLKQHIKACGNWQKDFEAIESFIRQAQVEQTVTAITQETKSKRLSFSFNKKLFGRVSIIIISLLIISALTLWRYYANSPLSVPESRSATTKTEADIEIREHQNASAAAGPVQQEKTVSKKETPAATAAATAFFSGTIVNGYPDGFGTYTFKTRRRIDMHDPESRFADVGDYIKGDWKQGHLNYGEWYDAEGNKKAFIRLGDHPDVESDQKLGKCQK